MKQYDTSEPDIFLGEATQTLTINYKNYNMIQEI